MMDDLMDQRRVAQLRKISNGLVKILVNKTEGTQQLIQKIRQGDMTLRLSHGFTEEAIPSEHQKMGHQDGENPSIQ